jgi:hypothetical protein
VRITELQDTIKLHGVDSPQFYAAAAELKVVQGFVNDATEQLTYTAEQNNFKVGEGFWGQIGKSVETAAKNLVGVNNKELTDDFGIKLVAAAGSALAFAGVGLLALGVSGGSAAAGYL